MWKIWVKNGLTCPAGGSLVELAYEGVSSKFSCFLILGRPRKARLVTSPPCAKQNNSGTLLTLLTVLATTCYTIWPKEQRETILSEKKRPKQLVKKYERLKNLIFSVSGAGQWTCSCPALFTSSFVFLAIMTEQPQWSSTGRDQDSQPSGPGVVKVKAAESESAILQIGQKSVREQFLLFSLAPAFKFYCSRKSARIWFERLLVIELALAWGLCDSKQTSCCCGIYIRKCVGIVSCDLLQ